MPYSKKADSGLDIDGLSTRLSLDPDMLSILANQMRHSSEKKNKAQNLKIRRAVKDQLEKISPAQLLAKSELLEMSQDQLASRAQDYLTSRAKVLDKIRGLWTAIYQQREALMELLQTEEKAANQLDLEREKDSVAYLSQARDDIEGQRRIQAMLD